MKKVYDITEEQGTVQIIEIEVLEESIVPGATVPTYLVKYPNGSKARCSIDMYSTSPQNALIKALSDVKEDLEYIEQKEKELKKEKTDLQELRWKLLRLEDIL